MFSLHYIRVKTCCQRTFSKLLEAALRQFRWNLQRNFRRKNLKVKCWSRELFLLSGLYVSGAGVGGLLFL